MKKMRKLIPAFAMLMIAAIMMTTASFAWFTMNENVTATGMQVQAKASGNLLISLEPMTAADQLISVNLNNTKKELTPVTHTTTGTGTSATHAWQIPNGDVDPNFGTVIGTAGLKDIASADAALPGDAGYDADNAKYFSDYIVYLATAGDASAMANKKLEITLEALAGADQKLAPAYSVAFYVEQTTSTTEGETTTTTTEWKYAGKTNYKTGVVTFDESFAIPSTYGATSDSKVGLKLLMRVYVDGALEGPKTSVKIPAVVAADTDLDSDENTVYYNPTQMANWIFYSDAEGTTVVNKDETWGATKDITAYYYWDGVTMIDGPETTTNYVNNNTVPTGSTTFSVTIAAK